MLPIFADMGVFSGQLDLMLCLNLIRAVEVYDHVEAFIICYAGTDRA